MGWTGLHREPGTPDRDFFEREFPTALGAHGKIVACATVRSVFYAAVQNNETAPSAPGETWALVVMIRRGRGYSNFHYKEMSEESGPAYHDAPATVLDALTPTDHEYATEWRAECRAALAKRAAMPKVRAGDVVVFAVPITFSDNRTSARFTWCQRSVFRSEDGRLYRIPNWKARAFTVAEATR